MRVFPPLLVYLIGLGLSACAPQEAEDAVSVEFLLPRCAENSADALYCFELGKRFLEARGTERNPKEARRFFKKACELNLSRGCHNWALMMREGLGGADDEEGANRLFQKACRQNNRQSCVQQVGALLADRTSSKADAAKRALSKACRLGFSKACGGFARLAFSTDNGLLGTAAAWRGYYEGCEGGDADACEQLQSLKDVDPRDASTTACDKGDGLACRFLGLLADNGRFGPRDRAAARGYYERACERGVAVSCTDAGSMWAEGIGGPADLGRARTLFERACGQDGLVGCADLSVLLEWDGDLEGARRLRERACFNGHAKSCARLAWFLSWGWGGLKDRRRAEVLLGQACDLGDADACRTQKGDDL